MTNHEMEERIKTIATAYNRAVQDLIGHGITLADGYLFDPGSDLSPARYLDLHSGDPEIYRSERLVLKVNYALSIMPERYQLIIWSDFFRNRQKNWYLTYFCKSSYYRAKKQALKAFLELQC